MLRDRIADQGWRIRGVGGAAEILGLEQFPIVAAEKLPTGKSTLRFEFAYDVGIDLATPVIEAIGSQRKSKFTGRIPRLTVEVQ